MSVPCAPLPARPFLSVLGVDWSGFWSGLRPRLEALLGDIDYESALIPFTQTACYLPRFTVTTRHDGEFAFSTRDNKGALRAMRPYVGEDSLVRACSLTTAIAQCLKRVLGNLFRPSSHES